MTAQLGEVWGQALERIAVEDSAPSLDGWLRTIKPLALYDNTVIVACPNDFSRQWLETRYHGILRRALSGVAAREIDVRFVTNPDAAPAQEHPSAEGSALRAAPVPRSHVGPGRPEQLLAPAGRVLNPRYTFESFVVGSGNRFAHAAAQAVAGSPAKVYNPLFIYGGVGLGKTHLLQAIAHQVLASSPLARVAYVSSELFTNELIDSIRSGATPAFRARYRNVDLLLVDDVQFLAGKEATQEEFFHTFNALHEATRQIVLTSDRPPKEIPTLEERLRSRFEWGLTADIQPPDYETRVAILRKKARTDGLAVPDDVLHYIAGKFDSNIRELEGALVRVVALASLSGTALSTDVAARALRDIVAATRSKTASIDNIIRTVAAHYQITQGELLAHRRTKAVAFPRQVAMYLSRQLTEASLPRIGEAFGGRDHTTVMHACDRVRQEIVRDSSLSALLQDLTDKARSR
ncbi:MAG: chromosomal replication initiator protein DnaA [Bacillota bacterium]|nr:chromosomal replication initiator protein DnaA [Bacillota bacterium]